MEVVDFYRQQGARRLLVLSGLLLFYGGSIPVFYVHAVVRAERGPRIDHLYHWALDSTLVFVGLTPALAVVLPLALAALRRAGAARPGTFALLAGLVITIVTAPGPLLHQLVAGRGTPLAELAERATGARFTDVDTDPISTDLISSGLVQVAVGLPTYVALLALAVAVAGRHLAVQPVAPPAHVTLPRQRGRSVPQRRWARELDGTS